MEMNPFETLGLSPDTSMEEMVLKAWRKLAMTYHPDKVASNDGGYGFGNNNDTRMKELNNAKEQCLKQLIQRNHTESEQEFVHFVCRRLEKSIAKSCDLQINLGDLIRLRIREFMWIHAVDAMKWVLDCVVEDAEFNGEIEAQIPTLRKYYNFFIGEDGWDEDDHTFMAVLNKYDQIKAGGYGNFARRLE